MLRIENLEKRYRNSDKLAVDGVSLHVGEGEIFGFLGPNGAGKSTTIKCVCGILPFEKGRIEICGKDLARDPIGAKMQMGYVSDNHAVYDKLTAREYVNFMADVYGVGAADRKARSEKLVELFCLGDAYDSEIKTYSHGMKQKICVIGALVHNPKLWILDEPMTGLDPKSSFELKELMREHCKEGNSVFFSSHVLEVVEKVCDHVAIINGGRMIADFGIDELDDIKRNSSLEDVFLTLTDGSASAQNDGATEAR